MKNYHRIIIWLFTISLYSLCQTAYAETTLEYHVTGIQGSALKNVEARLEAAKKTAANGNPLTETKIKEFYASSISNIHQALEPFAYFKAKVQGELIHKDSAWIANYIITPGPQLPLVVLDVKIHGDGAGDPTLVKLIKNLPLTVGQPLLIDNYNKTTQELFQTAENLGYMKANLERKEIRIDLKNYAAVVILHFNTGRRYYFGELQFNKNPFSSKFLERFATFKKNDPFSPNKLLDFQQALNSSGYFEQVNVKPSLQKAAGFKVPVKAHVTPKKSQQYNFGLGYGSYTGPRISMGVDLRRLTDDGQHFSAQIKLSPVLSGIAAKYFIPGKHPLTDQYVIGENLQKFEPKNGSSLSQNLSVGSIKSYGDWKRTLTLNYLIERYKVIDTTSQVSNLVIPKLNLSRIKTDNLINPSYGSSVNFILQGASEQVFSATDFFQAEIQGKYIYSFTPKNRFIVRGDFGYTTVSDLSQLPLSLRFFAGGPGSVRGYPYASMGPGRYIKVASIEYQYNVTGNWWGIIFRDAGIADDHFGTPMRRSLGAGVLYSTPVGPIAVTLAQAEDATNKPYRIDFSIGPQF